jgi:aspartyl-tRNA(Asn)/glutamyl-tRNA(Gln) amidotransferase subunit C
MISKDEVKHIASLARIGMPEEETEKFSEDISAILDWIEELKEADIEKVEPTSHITGLKNKTREDRIKDFENKAEIVKLFPESKKGYDKVKSVL